MTDFSDRQVRIQIKDQIDRMKRKKQLDEYEWSGSEDEGGSLDPPTVKKHGEGVCVCVCACVRACACACTCIDCKMQSEVSVCLSSDGLRSGAAALSPTRVSWDRGIALSHKVEYWPPLN